MSERLNMTGFWVGEYRYYQPFEPVVSFLANLDEVGGAITGSISEPNVYSHSTDRLDAFVRGCSDGQAVHIAKTYDGAADFAHRVDYEGTLSEDGLSLVGTWALSGESGPFRMSRTDPQAEEHEVEQEQIETIAR